MEVIEKRLKRLISLYCMRLVIGTRRRESVKPSADKFEIVCWARPLWCVWANATLSFSSLLLSLLRSWLSWCDFSHNYQTFEGCVCHVNTTIISFCTLILRESGRNGNSSQCPQTKPRQPSSVFRRKLPNLACDVCQQLLFCQITYLFFCALCTAAAEKASQTNVICNIKCTKTSRTGKWNNESRYHRGAAAIAADR